MPARIWWNVSARFSILSNRKSRAQLHVTRHAKKKPTIPWEFSGRSLCGRIRASYPAAW